MTSRTMHNTPRKGFHSITPRIVVANVGAQIAFLRAVFDAAGAREPFPAFLYVYVDDADAVYRRALAAGAVSLEEPLDTPYGDRRAMVRGPFGNVWQIAHVS
jgi:hypothetical protein